MEISIRPMPLAPVPTITPLSLLSPDQLKPSNGIAATLAGIKEGQAITAPAAEAVTDLGKFYQPQNVAARKASIAKSGLEETTADQQNTAAKETPNLPLSERQLALSRTEAGKTLVGPMTSYALAKIGSEEERLPSETESAILGNRANSRLSGKVLGTTPNYDPNVPDSDVQAWYEDYNAQHPSEGQQIDTSTPLGLSIARGLYNDAQNAKIKANRLDEATMNREVMQAGIPSDSSASGVHYVFNGTKMVVDPTENVDLPGSDGKLHKFVQGRNSGKIYNDLGVSGSQNKIDDINSRQDKSIDAAGARQDKTIGARTVTYNTPDGKVRLLPGDAREVDAVVQNFRTRADVAAISKIQPVIQKAFATIAAGTDAKTGIPALDSMMSAAQIFRGSKVTDTEMKSLGSAGGTQQNLFKLWNSWDGKQYDDRTISDLTNALKLAQASGSQYLESVKDEFANALPDNAVPLSDKLYGRVAHIMPDEKKPPEEGESDKGMDVPGATAQASKDGQTPAQAAGMPHPATPEDMNALPSGTFYVDPKGNIRKRS